MWRNRLCGACWVRRHPGVWLHDLGDENMSAVRRRRRNIGRAAPALALRCLRPSHRRAAIGFDIGGGGERALLAAAAYLPAAAAKRAALRINQPTMRVVQSAPRNTARASWPRVTAPNGALPELGASMPIRMLRAAAWRAGIARPK